MADKTKIMLSEEELRIVNDVQWILTKQEIIQKVYAIFNKQVAVIRNCFEALPEKELTKLSAGVPKISKGENYRGLPWVMLDYPSVFGKEEIFALRTMMWWGNCFSVSLLLSGEYKRRYGQGVLNNAVKNPGEMYVCVHPDPWQHHFDPSNFIPLQQVKGIAMQQEISGKDFLKLAIKADLRKWNEIDSLLEAAYTKIICLLKD